MFKREITKVMKENGFHIDGEVGMRTFKRVRDSEEDTIAVGWWANEKVAKADKAYRSHLFIQLPMGRFRLPFTKFIPENGNIVEKNRDWDEFRDELVDMFIGSFTDTGKLIEVMSDSRYRIKAPAPELEEN